MYPYLLSLDNMSKYLNNLTEDIKTILKKYPESRNNDTYLTVTLWQEFYGVSGRIDTDEMYYLLPPSSSIERIRRMIQNSWHMYLPTSEAIARKRKINMEYWKSYTHRDKGPSY